MSPDPDADQSTVRQALIEDLLRINQLDHLFQTTLTDPFGEFSIAELEDLRKLVSSERAKLASRIKSGLGGKVWLPEDVSHHPSE